MTEIRQAMPLYAAEVEELRFLPEGPYPLADGRFSWVAIQHGANTLVGSLNLYDMDAQTNATYALPGRPGFAFPCQSDDVFVVGCERTLGLFNVASARYRSFCEGIDAEVANTIINDGMIYEDNLIFGTKDLEFATQKAGLYLWRGRDKNLITLRDDQICSNGKAMRKSVDGGLQLIDIDSPTRQVVSYPLDIESGTLGPATVVLDLTHDPAVPDGAILTPDGSGIIVSMFLPDAAADGETRWYELESGNLICTWKTAGSPQNTCPALIRHQDTLKLIITTAVENMAAEIQANCPNAGKLFVGEIDLDDPGGPLAPVFPM